MSVSSAKDIHAVLVSSAIKREDDIAAAAEEAATTDTAEIVKEAIRRKDSAWLVDSLLRAAVVSSAVHLDSQTDSAISQVKEEAGPLKRTPAEKVPAVRNEDIAEQRANKMTEDK